MKTETEKAAEKEGRATPKEKPMTRGEAIEELDSLIGTAAPLVEAEQLRRVVALHGSDELPPELEKAVEDIKSRTKDSQKK